MALAKKPTAGPGGGKKRHRYDANNSTNKVLSLKDQIKTMSKLMLNMELLFLVFCIFFAVISVMKGMQLQLVVFAFLTLVEGIAVTVALIPQKRYYIAIFNSAALIIVFWRFAVLTTSI